MHQIISERTAISAVDTLVKNGSNISETFSVVGTTTHESFYSNRTKNNGTHTGQTDIQFY